MSNSWNKNKLIGNNAENIIQYLINSMPDWECMNFGVENHIKDIISMVGADTNPLSLKIRKMPDFVAFNQKTKQSFFVEIKCCSKPPHSDGYFFSHLEEIDKYWDGTKLIIVNPYEPHFVYINLKEINESMKREIVLDKKLKEIWVFPEEIKRDIKELFPDLEDDKIIEATECIIKKSKNETTNNS